MLASSMCRAICLRSLAARVNWAWFATGTLEAAFRRFSLALCRRACKYAKPSVSPRMIIGIQKLLTPRLQVNWCPPGFLRAMFRTLDRQSRHCAHVAQLMSLQQSPFRAGGRAVALGGKGSHSKWKCNLVNPEKRCSNIRVV
jgi:hypothetical protein